MIQVSVCMIVKNEEKVLKRCLDSLKGLWDELIIVDTGSEDATKKIAAEYTNLIYDFQWTGSFSDARNFAFSKAEKEYIYSADADEVLDEENRSKFFSLKEHLLSEIEIVQMKYGNQLSFGTIYNFDEELRPKLFKRQREFRWKEPVHEMVLLDPVIYDSDIVITHMPLENHAGRDLAVFRRHIHAGERLSARLHTLYAKELFIAGSREDFLMAEEFFKDSATDACRGTEEIKEACCVIAKAARFREDIITFYKYALKGIALEGCSELCCELGEFYVEQGDIEEAIVWFYNAGFETSPILSARHGGNFPRQQLAKCYELVKNFDMAAEFRKEAEAWESEHKEIK